MASTGGRKSSADGVADWTGKVKSQRVDNKGMLQ